MPHTRPTYTIEATRAFHLDRPLVLLLRRQFAELGFDRLFSDHESPRHGSAWLVDAMHAPHSLADWLSSRCTHYEATRVYLKDAKPGDLTSLGHRLGGAWHLLPDETGIITLNRVHYVQRILNPLRPHA